MADDHSLSGTRDTRAQGRCSARLRCSFLEGARPPDGQGRGGKRIVGCGSQTEKYSFVETAGRNTKRNCLRSFDRDSGFRRAASRENSDRTGRWISTHQGKGQAWLGPECAGEDSLAMGRYHAELRCQFCVYARSSGASSCLRSVQPADDRATALGRRYFLPCAIAKSASYRDLPG